MLLITEEYRRLNAQMHADKPNYGRGAMGAIEEVRRLVAEHKLTSVIDYGAGKRGLEREIAGGLSPRPRTLRGEGGEAVAETAVPEPWFVSYDPALPEIAEPPKAPADLVVCMDVMEHIEPDHLDAVLAHIRSLTLRMAFFGISTQPASKTLPDGRNAHLIVQPHRWWIDKVGEHFRILRVLPNAKHAVLYCAPKPESLT